MSELADPEACNGRGKVLAERGELDAAIEQFEAAYLLWKQADDAQSTKGLRNWCRMLIQQGKYDSAARKAGEALRAEPDNEQTYDIYNSLANALVKAGNFDDAEWRWREAVAIGEDAQAQNRAIALRAWAEALTKRKKYGSAATKAYQALKIEPDDKRSYGAYNSLANALVKDGRFEEAEWRWQEAVAIGDKARSRNRVILLRTWGAALAERKDYEAAAIKLREALKIEPDDGRSYGTRNALAIVLRAWVEALIERQDFVRAPTTVREALEIQPDDELSYNAYNDLANALVKDGRFDEAARLWQQAIEIGEKAQSKNRAIALRAWAGALTKRKDYGSASTRAFEALRIGPDDKRSYGVCKLARRRACKRRTLRGSGPALAASRRDRREGAIPESSNRTARLGRRTN